MNNLILISSAFLANNIYMATSAGIASSFDSPWQASVNSAITPALRAALETVTRQSITSYHVCHRTDQRISAKLLAFKQKVIHKFGMVSTLAVDNAKPLGSKGKFTCHIGQFDSVTAAEIEKDSDFVGINRMDQIFTKQGKLINIKASTAENTTGADYIWGLHRIAGRANANSLKISETTKFKGKDVTVYVVDTGSDQTLEDFGGRVRWGTNTIDSENIDCDGHGTHVMGTVLSNTYGVATEAKGVAVKALNCNGQGSYQNIMDGLTWAANDCKANTNGKCVINLSVGGTPSSNMNLVVDTIVSDDNIPVVVAAGNDYGSLACSGSPSGATKAFTVGASDINDNMAAFSNLGTCTNVFGPGDMIKSLVPTDLIPIYGPAVYMSGTSMACPHTSGVAALFLSNTDCGVEKVEEVYGKIKTYSTKDDTVQDLPNPFIDYYYTEGFETPNRLLYYHDACVR